MKKTMIIVGLAVLAATATMTAQAPSAEAGLFRGVKQRLFGVRVAPRFHHHHRHVYRRPVYTETYRETYRAPPRMPPPRVPAQVAYADDQGREYDPATRVWFDGKDQCWTGRQPWVFRSGSWHYGASPWRRVEGVWQTNAAVEPVAVSCSSSPLFAAKAKPEAEPERKVSSKRLNGYSEGRETDSAPETPKRTAEKAPSGGAGDEPEPTKPSSSECTKYFPAVGKSLPVPCS